MLKNTNLFSKPFQCNNTSRQSIEQISTNNKTLLKLPNTSEIGLLDHHKPITTILFQTKTEWKNYQERKRCVLKKACSMIRGNFERFQVCFLIQQRYGLVGSTIFSTNKESMMLSKCLINSLRLVITFEKNAYKKSFEVTQSHGVNSNKSKSTSLICFIHQEG